MTTKYFATLTNQGAARLANATALGLKLNITQMAVGDGGGTLPTPSPTQTTLINQLRIAAINSLNVDDNDAGQIIAEQVIPENEGGFWIREIGLYDDTGVLIAVANCPETYKPLLTEGSGRTQTIRMILVVSSSASITLKVDPSVVLATRKYVDDGVVEVKSYVDKQVKAHEAKANPHAQYLMIENALKEIADAGLVDKALANLGLNEWRYPVGSYYENEVDSRNPSVILGFGVWEPRTGLLYGAGTVSDKALIDSEGKPLEYEISVGAIQGRLFVTQENIASDYLTGETGTPNADDPDQIDEDGDHEHEYDKLTGTTPKGGDTNNAAARSYTSTTTTGGGRHKHGVRVDIGKQTEPFMIPGFACNRWVRVE